MRSPIFFRSLAWLVLGLFCAVLVLSFFVPIYTDEITVKIARSRALLDGLVLTSLHPQCGAPYVLSIPWTWTPSALIYWLLYANVTEPMQLRVIGMLSFVLWLGMVAWFIRQHLKIAASRLHVMAGMISLLSLGVLPFLLVLNRGEQALLIGITLACILPFIVTRYPPKSQAAWALLAALFCLIVSYMFYSHPKTLFFIPLLAVSALHLAIASRRAWVGVSTLGGLVLTCYESLSFISKRLSCSEAPFLEQIIKSHGLSPSLLFSSPIEFLHGGLSNLLRLPAYVTNILFQPRYQSDYLPFINENKLDVLSRLINVGVGVIYVVLVGYALVLFAGRLRRDWRERELKPATTIPAGLLFGIVMAAFLLNSRNFYESSLVVPLFLLLFALLLPSIANSVRWRRLHSYMFAFLLVVSILSQMNLIRVFATYVPNQWGEGGQVAGQWLSVSTSDFTQVRKEVLEVAARCGIKPGEANSHLVIDDITYFVFHDAYRPFHALYIGPGWGRDIGGDTNYLPFLNKNNSAGVIARCERLPPESRRLSTESGDYCCISRQDIKRLSEQMTSP